jgi:hypothetical protein
VLISITIAADSIESIEGISVEESSIMQAGTTGMTGTGTVMTAVMKDRITGTSISSSS